MTAHCLNKWSKPQCVCVCVCVCLCVWTVPFILVVPCSDSSNQQIILLLLLIEAFYFLRIQAHTHTHAHTRTHTHTHKWAQERKGDGYIHSVRSTNKLFRAMWQQMFGRPWFSGGLCYNFWSEIQKQALCGQQTAGWESAPRLPLIPHPCHNLLIPDILGPFAEGRYFAARLQTTATCCYLLHRTYDQLWIISGRKIYIARLALNNEAGVFYNIT